jgi:phosphatidylserine/phosphatidylglycerophosphate/cardiolipin synthase-like enzyme
LFGEEVRLWYYPRMLRLAIRFTKSLAILLVILSVSVGVGIGYYVVHGGDLSRLEIQGGRSLDKGIELADPKALFEKGEALREKTAALGNDVTTFLSRKTGDTGMPIDARSQVELGNERESVGSGSKGGIQVYFAPCAPADPFGIDDAFLGFLNSAKRSIHGAFFEFELPAAAEVCIEKHKQGVDVRIVSDSNYKGRAAIQSCIAAGIPVVFDNRDAFMHNKFCVVDERLVWTGSTNITENCMYRNDNNSLVLDSPRLAQDFSAEFDEMFDLHAFGKKSPRNTPYPEVEVGDARVECYFAPEDHVQQAIIGEIGTAQSEIDVMAFSFTSVEIAKAMAARIEKGVKVRAVFDQRQAGTEHSQDDYIAKRGASVRLDNNPYAMHNKVIIIDAKAVVTGSYNFTKSADTQNDENVLIIHSPNIAKIYLRKFESLVSGMN